MRPKFRRADTATNRTGEPASPTAIAQPDPLPPLALSKEVRARLDNAQALFRQQSYADARRQVEQILVIDPRNAQAKDLLIRLDRVTASAGTRQVLGAISTGSLEQLYQQDVVAPCRVEVEGRYPFGNGTDMALADFGEMFGHGGAYDKFFSENLAKLVDKSQRHWNWREGSVHPSDAVLPQFERAERIRQMFFSAGSKVPELDFVVRLWTPDHETARFFLNIDGQKLGTAPGATSGSPVVWPGPEKRGIAVATFEDRAAAPEQVMRFEGPWAWLRLIDAANARATETPVEPEASSLVRFQTRDHYALVTIEAPDAMKNPFGAKDWRRFKCEP